MAKKDISKFQKALLSKTNMMKEEPKKEVESSEPVKKINSENKYGINNETLEKYKELSKKHSIDLKELIHFGLNFFLEFEDELFKK